MAFANNNEALILNQISTLNLKEFLLVLVLPHKGIKLSNKLQSLVPVPTF
jgi:hypothetical protein